MSSSTPEILVNEDLSFLQPLVILVLCFIMGFAYCKREFISPQEEPIDINVSSLSTREKKRLNEILKNIKADMDKIAKIDEELKIIEAKIPTKETMNNIDSQ
jgi:hypothetical protein